MRRHVGKLAVVASIVALALVLVAGSALAHGGEPSNDTAGGNRLAQMANWMGPENWGQLIQHMTQIHGPEWTGQMLQWMNQHDMPYDGSGSGHMMGHGFGNMTGWRFGNSDDAGLSGMMGRR